MYCDYVFVKLICYKLYIDEYYLRFYDCLNVFLGWNK